MDDRTREYLKGSVRRLLPPGLAGAPAGREPPRVGPHPVDPGSGTTMLRHQSLYDLGDVDTFFADNAPRHAYFSAARYDDPGASTMSQKGWRSADLVFDLADHDHLLAS